MCHGCGARFPDVSPDKRRLHFMFVGCRDVALYREVVEGVG